MYGALQSVLVFVSEMAGSMIAGRASSDVVQSGLNVDQFSVRG